MAGVIPVLNSQGTKIYIVDVPSTPWADCTAAVTAIKAGKLVGCPQSIGSIEESRAVTEYKCMSSNETAKALGSITRGNIEIGLLFDPDDTDGQKALKDAWLANSTFVVGIELPDIDVTAGATGASGTLFWFSGAISAVSTGIVQDEAISYTVTIEISSNVTECPKVAGKAP